MSSLIEELKRRNVFKVVAAYAVTGFIILQLCDILFPALGIADEVIGTVLLVLLLILPAVVMFAWMYELTPDGLRRTHEVSSQESIAGLTGRRMNQIIIALLSIAVVFFAFEYFQAPEPQPAETVEASGNQPLQSGTAGGEPTEAQPVDTRPSIAVLPFVNMSSDIENEHFSDGLSEEMLNLLAQVNGLRVAGRTSSFFYKGKNINLTEIGEALNVDHILEGSVRKSGSTVRITAQLISAGDGFHLWSKTFDRELDDIFAIQDEIAGEVTRAMQVTLLTDGIVADRTTTNTEAYDLYLRGKDALYTRGRDSLLRAIKLFEQAMALDPEYAPPLVDYAIAKMVIYSNHQLGSLEASSETAADALNQAKNLGYLTSDYYAALGLYHMNLIPLDASNFEPADLAFAKAVELNPNNVRAYMWWATLQDASIDPNRLERGAELNRKAIELDPLNRIANGNHTRDLVVLGKIAEAESHLKRLVRLDPDYPTYRIALANFYERRSRFDEAVEVLVKIPEHEEGRLFIGVLSLLALNEPDLADDFIGLIPVGNPNLEYAEIFRLSLLGEPAEIRAEAEVILLSPDPEFFAGPLIPGLLEIGEPGMARRLIENARPEFRKAFSDMSFTLSDPHDGYMKAAFLAGDVTRAQQHAQKLLEVADQYPPDALAGFGSSLVSARIILGDMTGAFEELRVLREAGWLGYYRDLLHRDPLWQTMRDEPDFQPILATINDELDRQRPKVIATLRDAGLISSL